MLQQRFEAEFQRRVQASLAATSSSVDESGDDGYEVRLFGSKARRCPDRMDQALAENPSMAFFT